MALLSASRWQESALTRSPDILRRGAVTFALTEEVSRAVVTDRCDVSVDVLEKQSNRQTEQKTNSQGAVSRRNLRHYALLNIDRYLSESLLLLDTIRDSCQRCLLF